MAHTQQDYGAEDTSIAGENYSDNKENKQQTTCHWRTLENYYLINERIEKYMCVCACVCVWVLLCRTAALCERWVVVVVVVAG